MALVYTIDELKYLRSSPLAVKPPGLPPTEQWMGPAADLSRNKTKPSVDKFKNESDMLLDSSNRRLVSDRNVQRNNANPEDIILGPPKTSFVSATSIKSSGKNVDSPDRPGLRESGFGFKTKIGISENERSRDNRNSKTRSRRAEGDEENDVWNVIQPRKSFGADGSERLNTRIGVEKIRDDRTYRDKEEVDRRERPRGAENFARDKIRDRDQDRDRNHRSHGIGRGRNEQSWFKERDNFEAPVTSKERHSNSDKNVDRSRGWRMKDKDERGERGSDRFAERNGTRDDLGDRTWDRGRDKANEYDPEWMEDQIEEKNQPRTTADFEKWKEQMQGRDRAVKISKENTEPEVELSLGAEKRKSEAPLEFDSGPDKFLSLFSPKIDIFSEAPSEIGSDGARKPTIAGKASRFTSFFNTQDDPHKVSAETLPEARPQPSAEIMASSKANVQSSAEKEAFQQLLQKLQRQSFQASSSNSPSTSSLPSKIPVTERISGSIAPPLDLYQTFQNDHKDEGRPSPRNSQQDIQGIFTQRQIAESQNMMRAEQMLQDLATQRQNAALNLSAQRLDQPLHNVEYSTGLMQNAQSAPDPQRLDQILMRMPSKSDTRQIPQHIGIDREPEIHRDPAAQGDRITSERQPRTQPPPGFFDDSSFSRGAILPHERQTRNSQPTQILQRPPGLEMAWDRQAPLQPPQHRIAQNIAPPPGLSSNINRAMPIPQQIFTPGFPSANFPPPDVMSVPPPRNMQMQPPPGLFNGPPPSFLTPGMGGFQGPEGMAFSTLYDGRGPPTQGTYRRP